MADNAETIKDLMQPHLEGGEVVTAAMTAQPKGRTTAMAAGGVGSMIGHAQTNKVAANADAVGLKVGSPMAVVLTSQRLITAKLKISAIGHVTEVKEILSALPLTDIDTVEAKRFGLGGILSITAKGGSAIKLECRTGPAKAVADAFASAKGSG